MTESRRVLVSPLPGDIGTGRFAASVIKVGMILRESEYAGDATLDDALVLMPEVERDTQREEFADLVAQLA